MLPLQNRVLADNYYFINILMLNGKNLFSVVAPVKPANKKKTEGASAKSGAVSAGGKLTDPNAIISAVRMVSLEEKQVQQLIDILLNKQQASSKYVQSGVVMNLLHIRSGVGGLFSG
jgi:hypothetical protein